MTLAELQAMAAAQSPMAPSSVPVLHARTLYTDGDGLAYYCAGNDDTLLAEARHRLADKVESMTLQSGSATSTTLLTGSGSHKGHRYAIARVKPYQGQRANSRRPKNWQGLRDLLADGHFGTRTEITMTAEADDLFGRYGHADPEGTVIATQDKDMRMVPGWHMDWVSNLMCYLPPGEFDFKFNDKQYGLKWFWLQMLHGDTADFIPGLPFYMGKDAKGKAKLKPVGPVTAEDMLAGTANNIEAADVVYEMYHSYYKERALVEMLEQAALLWMRRNENWDDCLREGGPMHVCKDLPEMGAAYHEINSRVKTVEAYAQTEND